MEISTVSHLLRIWPLQQDWRKLLDRSEDMLTVLALTTMVILPLTEIVLRKFFHTGIASAMTIEQHLVLCIGMLGGAIAAREGRLLSLSSATGCLKGRWKEAATLLSSSLAATVTFYLFLASLRFAETKRETGEILADILPLWIILAVLPVGFALVTWRLIRHAAATGKFRLLSAAIAGAFALGAGVQPVIEPARLLTPALVMLIAAAAFGAPIFTLLGGAALLLFWGTGQPIAMVSIDHYRLTVDATLPAIPLFTLAGYFLAEGGASRRLIRVFQAILGHVRGGHALVTASVCALFTAFTGASGVTILALGGLLMPILLAARYSERDALGLVTSAGSLGLLFPPCLPLILYAVVATTIGSEISIAKMFLGGIVPGILLMALTAWWGIRSGSETMDSDTRFDVAQAASAVREAKWELLMPLVALVSLFGGFATTVEAAAITAFYAFAIEVFVYRDLDICKDVPRVMTECGLLIGGILLILGLALGFNDFLFTANVPERLVELARSLIYSRYTFLVALNLFLLAVGCLMDVYSAIVVVAPLIIPLGREFHVDPVHLGIIFLANLELGFLTPPVGMNLFISSYRFGKPVNEVIRSVLPMFGILLLGVLLITYLPILTTLLPKLLIKSN